MYLILIAHSINRYLISIAALIAIVFLAKDISAKQSISKVSKLFSSIFSGLMDLQFLLGSAYLAIQVSLGLAIQPDQHKHLGIMFIAIIVGHLPAMFKKKNPTNYPTYMLIGIIIALILVFVGVLSLSNGLHRWISITGLF